MHAFLQQICDESNSSLRKAEAFNHLIVPVNGFPRDLRDLKILSEHVLKLVIGKMDYTENCYLK